MIGPDHSGPPAHAPALPPPARHRPRPLGRRDANGSGSKRRPSWEHSSFRTIACACAKWRSPSSKGSSMEQLGSNSTTTCCSRSRCRPARRCSISGLQAYDGWVGVIVHPGDFVIPRQISGRRRRAARARGRGAQRSLEGGPVLLSWFHWRRGAQEGVNVVIHEFAHKLDMENGGVDGRRGCAPGMSRQPGPRSSSKPTRTFCAEVEAVRHRDRPLRRRTSWRVLRGGLRGVRSPPLHGASPAVTTSSPASTGWTRRPRAPPEAWR